jgi:phosphotransferase system HPr (HPr) family protein
MPVGNEFATERFVMRDPFGFHARPAALFVKTARQYEADVMVGGPEGPAVNGKSILELLTLGVRCGEIVTVASEGRDAVEAVLAIGNLFAGALGRQPAQACA